MVVLVFHYIFEVNKALTNQQLNIRMKPQQNLSLVLLTTIFLSSCAGSGKIDFNSAYKFSKYNYTKTPATEHITQIHENPIDPDPSEKTMAKENFDLTLDQAEQNISEKMGIPKDEAKSMDAGELAKTYKQLDRKVKREIKQQVKAELKQFNYLQANTALSVSDVQQTNELTGYTKLAVFIGGGGLVLLIFGAIFSAGFLSVVGALAIVAGAVLFIMDQN